jgi:hypothetical protein
MMDRQEGEKPKVRRFPYTFVRELEQKPRGGLTQGTKVQFAAKIPQTWNQLQEGKLNQFERDRRAILALVGEFKTSFEFLETISIADGRSLDPPYQSWGTEIVTVLEDTKDFISLQHTMVMMFKDPKTGKEHGPMVMKHWRQDWKWEGKTLLEYQGRNKWVNKELFEVETKNKWTWHIYQVDDSPRYSGIGSWKHFQNSSIFTSGIMQRPLPRRERTLRNDYDILQGKDSLVVTPLAWFHEQQNFKLQSSEKGVMILAREIGHNKYQRIEKFDFKPGYDYLKKTGEYWEDVREVWRDLIRERKVIRRVISKEKTKPLFQYHFEQAQSDRVLKMKTLQRQKLIRETILPFLE